MTMQPDQENRPARPSPWSALWNVLFEPGKTFAAFDGDVPVLPPYLVAMALTLVTGLLTMPAMQRAVTGQMGAQPEALPDGFMRALMLGSTLVGSLMSPWISGVILALVALLFGQFSTSRVSFSSYFGLAGYAALPSTIGGVVQGLLSMNAASVEAMASISLSPAIFLPAGASPVLRSVLAMFNPFALWYYVLLCIGFATLHRSRWTKGLGLVITLFVLSGLFAVGGAALTANMKFGG